MPLILNEIDVQDVDFQKLNETKEKEDKTMEIDGTVKETIKRRKNDEKKKNKNEKKKKQKLEEQLIENRKKIEQMKKKKINK